jgi:uncharacterized membrane protein YraQ (UPF0718 family)
MKNRPGRDHAQAGGAGHEGAASERRESLVKAVRKARRQMTAMLPVLAGVILLVGLFQTFVSRAWVSAVFTQHPLSDAFFGAVFGSMLAGNPVNSYVIGRGFLDAGVGFAGVAAFILTWVTVGLIQLPAEVAALGLRFSLTRAVVAFALSIPLACVTSWLLGTVP